MNKFTVFALLIAFVVAGGAFADTKAKVTTGTVVSYAPSVLVVKVGKKDDSFVIDAKTVVETKNKKALDIATLKAGENVEVRFTEDAKKVMTALSVTLK